jgi:hypothetical protein
MSLTVSDTGICILGDGDPDQEEVITLQRVKGVSTVYLDVFRDVHDAKEGNDPTLSLQIPVAEFREALNELGF